MGYSSVTMQASDSMKKMLSTWELTETSDLNGFSKPFARIAKQCQFVEVCDNGHYVLRNHTDFYTYEKTK